MNENLLKVSLCCQFIAAEISYKGIATINEDAINKAEDLVNTLVTRFK